MLQLLQSAGARGRWTLKSPHHALALEELTAVYPDARLVLLHRDPVRLSGSVCSLIRTLTSTFSDADHGAYIARHWIGMLEEMLRRIEAFRASHPENPVLDVHYDDLVGDPVGTVERIYLEPEGRLYGDLIDPIDGEFRLPDGPGLGCEPDAEVIARYRVS